jgi:pimeloyl-ACP methyl ester carboxylesterase
VVYVRNRRLDGGLAHLSGVDPLSGGMESFSLDGWNTAFTVMGAGPPVVLIHNAGCDHQNWTPIARQLARTRTVILPDLLGFGASDAPSIPFTLENYGRQLLALLDHLEVDTADIVGHCVGGATALWLARHHPARIRRLILFTPATPSTLAGGPVGWIPAAVRRLGADRVLEPLVHRVLRRRIGRATFLRFLFGGRGCEDPAFLEHLDQLYQRPENLRGLANLMRSFQSFRTLDEPWPEPLPPTLLVWGRQNRLLPWFSSGRFRRALGADKTVALPGLGHLCVREAPQEVGRLIEEWLHFEDAS